MGRSRKMSLLSLSGEGRKGGGDVIKNLTHYHNHRTGSKGTKKENTFFAPSLPVLEVSPNKTLSLDFFKTKQINNRSGPILKGNRFVCFNDLVPGTTLVLILFLARRYQVPSAALTLFLFFQRLKVRLLDL